MYRPRDGRDGRDGEQGPPGVSAFEHAKSLGFAGSLPQWLATLKGQSGKDGLSAYEIAVREGFRGTVEEWLASLKGEKGEPGRDGKNAAASAYEFTVERDEIGRISGVIAVPIKEAA